MAEGIPELGSLGIEAVDDGVCEDTFENRRLLREAELRWTPVPPGEDGVPTGLITVRPAEPTAPGDRDLYEERKPILEDPRDPWSDYVDAREYPIDAEVPFWITRRVQKWRDWDEKERLPGSRKSREPHLPTRCTNLKSDGTRCWAWAVDEANEGRCRAHAPGAALAANMGHQIALAKVKVMQAMPAMADELEGLALNAASEQVRLKAITEMMDRGGVTATTEVNIGGGIRVERDPAEEIRERLAGLAERLTAASAAAPAIEPGHAAIGDGGDIVDAEVVTESAEPEEKAG